MKICAIICEFNPFHNGHAYLIEQVRATGRFDGILCVMSGHFTQRGDRAVLDKFTRAKHAVLGGADCVVELPAPFATSPAPVFAEGAIKIALSVPDVCAVAFGCEDMLDFKAVAGAALEENGQFRQEIAHSLADGGSYAQSYSLALQKICGANVNSPNNILALEYAKAVLKYRPEAELFPVKRAGAGYNDRALGGTYASASAIREHMGEAHIADYVPPFVAAELREDEAADTRWEAIVKYALAQTSAEQLAQVYGCGEGLANKLKSLQRLKLCDIIAQATSRRYPSSRIRRALTQNALKLTAEHIQKFLEGAEYIKPLAVKADRADEMLKALSSSPYPVVITGSDVERLDGLNAQLYEASRFADDVWCATADRDVYDCTIVKC